MTRHCLLPILLFSQSFAQPTSPAAWNVRHGEDATLSSVILLQRSGDSLVALRKGAEIRVPIDSLLWIEKIVGKKSGIAIPIGIAGGAALGYLLAAGFSKDVSTSDHGDEGGIPGPLIGAVIGAGVGGVAGGLIGSGEETERISLRKKSIAERSSVLDSIIVAQRPTAVDSLIKKDDLESKVAAAPTTPDITTRPGWRFTLKGGLASPVGEFGMKSGDEAGFAELGYVLGGDVSLYIGSGVWWITSASFVFNGVDESGFVLPAGKTVEAGSWFTIWPMTGFRVEGRGPSSFRLHGTIQVGIMVGNSPELTIQQLDVVGGVSSASGSSVAFGIGVGFALHHTFLFEVSYLSASPEYELLLSSSGTSVSQKAEQGTGLLLFMLGIGF